MPHDSAVTSACDRIGAYNYLKKYEYLLDKNKYSYKCYVSNEPKKIWLFWQQGYETAPELVKKCKDSVLKYNSNLEVVVLDNSISKRVKDNFCYIHPVPTHAAVLSTAFTLPPSAQP